MPTTGRKDRMTRTKPDTPEANPGTRSTRILRDPRQKAQDALDVVRRKHERIKAAMAAHEAALTVLRDEQEQLLREVQYLAQHPALANPPTPTSTEETA